MHRIEFTLIGCTLALVIVGCADGPTRPVTLPAAGSAAPNVLSIGDLRRAHPGTPCTAAKHRQFDFWLGEWRVTNPANAFAGTNHLTRELDGCAVMERWTGAAGFRGWSINTYDPSTDLWYQHWVDEGGLNLLLSGRLQNGSMVISGERRTLAGAVLIDRITYTPLPGGHMRQLWELSFDLGQTFPTVLFDGHYTPLPGIVPPPAPGTSFCSASAYRAADFLLGEWRVLAENGLELGRSTITAELSTCLVFERFWTPKGYEATAFLSYGRALQRWNRTYVDSEGNRIFLAGPATADGLMLMGDVALPNGERVSMRMTWTSTGPDSVEQLWEVSRDAGETWVVDQRLIYIR